MGLKRASIAVALVVCAVGALSCSKSPTSNEGPSVTVTVTVVNTAGLATLQDVQVLMDGTVFIENTSTTALATYTLNATEGLSSGNHTLGVKIVTQSTSPNTYTVTPSIEEFNSSGTLTNTILPTPITSSLATGAQDTFTFTN